VGPTPIGVQRFSLARNRPWAELSEPDAGTSVPTFPSPKGGMLT
jgi:hypothetical protein